MDSSDITVEQARQVHRVIFRSLSYLRRLELRLAHHDFDHTDRFHQLLVEAYDAMHKLSVETHYLSCDGGTGRPPRRPETP